MCEQRYETYISERFMINNNCDWNAGLNEAFSMVTDPFYRVSYTVPMPISMTTLCNISTVVTSRVPAK